MGGSQFFSSVNNVITYIYLKLEFCISKLVLTYPWVPTPTYMYGLSLLYLEYVHYFGFRLQFEMIFSI